MATKHVFVMLEQARDRRPRRKCRRSPSLLGPLAFVSAAVVGAFAMSARTSVTRLKPQTHRRPFARDPAALTRRSTRPGRRWNAEVLADLARESERDLAVSWNGGRAFGVKAPEAVVAASA
jgi:hypothetical protein